MCFSERKGPQSPYLRNVINFTNGEWNPRALDINNELWDDSISLDHSFTPNVKVILIRAELMQLPLVTPFSHI